MYLIEGGWCTSRVFTPEVLLPVLDEPGVALVEGRAKGQKVVPETAHFLRQGLHSDGPLHLHRQITPTCIHHIIVINDRFYTALFSTLEQTHCPPVGFGALSTGSAHKADPGEEH